MPVESVSMRTRVWSRRLRRNVWTAGSFVVLVLIGGLVSWRIHKDNAPQEYTPGEASQDITYLRQWVNLHSCRLGVPTSVRYDPQNPGNSLVVTERWMGLRQ